MANPGLIFELKVNGAPAFAQTIDQASNNVQRSLGRLNNAGRQLESGLGRSFSGVAGNIGFQVADIAVQLQNGTSALVAFTQQGSQIAGAFGPVGAIIGAVGAVLGALASAYFKTAEASDKATKSTRSFLDETSGVEGQVRDLEGAALAYSTAIGATAGAQSEATNIIIAETRREFEAKKDLLELELKRLQALRAQSDADISSRAANALQLRQKIDSVQPGDPRDPSFPRADPTDNASPERRIFAQRLTEFEELQRRSEIISSDAYQEEVKQLEAVSDELKKLRAEAALTEKPLRLLEQAVNSDFTALAGAARARGGPGGGGRSGGGGGSGATDTGAGERSFIDALVNQALVEFNEQSKIAEDRQKALVDAFLEGKNAADAQAKALGDVTDRLFTAARGADSFKDAVKKIGLELLNIATQAAFGQGPGGSIVNKLLGVTANGLIGLLDPLAGASFPKSTTLTGVNLGRITPNASGNVFHGGNVIPFASGGIVGAPTTFPMSGGRVGLMGEAGPEAIVPLRRGRDGKLGIASSGGGGLAVNITVDARGATEGTAAQIERRLQAFARDELPRQVRAAGQRGK